MTVDEKIEKMILTDLPDHPLSAMNLLSSIDCDQRRLRLASLIASAWRQHDINLAWNSVAQSALSSSEKQIIFNELWS